MTWFTEFMAYMWGTIARDAKTSPPTAAKDAYSKALGPHHPFFLRQGAKVAMLAAPNRKNFEKKLFGDVSSEKVMELMQEGAACLDKLRDTLWAFYNGNNLTKLE